MAINIAPHKTPGAAKVKILVIDFLNTCHSQLKAKLQRFYLIKILELG